MLLLVDCAGNDGNDLAASIFFNVRIVSKSPTEFSPPIGAFMELRSNANLPYLANLALNVFTVTFDQFIGSLPNKVLIYFIKRIILASNIWMVEYSNRKSPFFDYCQNENVL